MNLPGSIKLTISRLSRVFSDMSESYKNFWFSCIMDIVGIGRDSATYDEIINHMIAKAWYMVSEYHLNLGPSDTLEKLVLYIQSNSGLLSSAKESDILKFLASCADPMLLRYKSILTQNVPYRFQVPFLPVVRGAYWNSTPNVIERVNQDNSVIYHFGSESGLGR